MVYVVCIRLSNLDTVIFFYVFYITQIDNKKSVFHGIPFNEITFRSDQRTEK
mgnify:CR=1 FL=1